MALFDCLREVAVEEKPSRERFSVLVNNVGVIIADPVEHTLSPATLQTSAALYLLLKHDAGLAAIRMDEAEAVADDYLDDETAESFDEWLWRLPVPADHKLCPHCMC